MADVFQVKAIKPRKLDVFEVRWELLNAMGKEGKASVKELEKTARNFRGRKPRFWYDVVLTSDEAAVIVEPKGDADAVKKWTMLDEGTPAHIIRARRAPCLRFRIGYNSGTRPGTLRTRRAYYVGNSWRRARAVRHPGTQPRGWSKLVQDRRKPKYITAMNKALRRGMEKASR